MGGGVDYATAMHEKIMERIETAGKNLFNIGLMKYKLKQDQETFNLDKKIKGLEIKKAEYLLSPEQLKLAEDKLKAETQAQTALFNLRSIQMTAEETKQKKELDTYTVGMEMVKKFLAGTVTLPKGAAAKVGPFAITGEKGTGFTLNLGNEGDFTETPTNKAKELDDFLSGF